MLIEVAVIAVPSVLAQQGGAQEKMVVPLESVTAPDDQTAILKVGAANADAILATEGKETLRVIVRRVG